MALRRKKPEPAPAPQSLVAAAARMNVKALSWGSYTFGDINWQTELWRLYDCVPEFNAVVNWVGSACSRVRIYVAHVDEEGNIQGEVTAEEDPQIAALSANLLGGPAQRAEAIRSITISLMVVGECYVIGFARPDLATDEWIVISSNELKRYDQEIVWEQMAGMETISRPITESDIFMRIWTPHPRRRILADSPGRALAQVLREMEKLSRYLDSQLNSRLISAGVWFLPNELDFPKNPNAPEGGASLHMDLYEAAMDAVDSDGSPAPTLPLIVTGKSDVIKDIKPPLTFESVLSQQAVELRNDCRTRLAQGMHVEPEVVGGLGKTQGWVGWIVHASTIKSTIEPTMNRVSDAFVRMFLRPALEFLGKDPKRYTYAIDTAPLQVKPERFKDALAAQDKGVLSDAATRAEGDYSESQGPSVDEQAQKLAKALLLRDSNLIALPELRTLAFGKDVEIAPENLALLAQTQASPNGAPPPPAPPRTLERVSKASPPDTMPGAKVAKPVNANETITASGVPDSYKLALVGICDQVVHRALERANRKQLTREHRGKYQDIAAFELHTYLPPVTSEARARELLDDGAWTHLMATSSEFTGHDPHRLRPVLTDYCVQLLVSQTRHDPQLLVSHLQRAELL